MKHRKLDIWHSRSRILKIEQYLDISVKVFRCRLQLHAWLA